MRIDADESARVRLIAGLLLVAAVAFLSRPVAVAGVGFGPADLAAWGRGIAIGMAIATAAAVVVACYRRARSHRPPHRRDVAARPEVRPHRE